jgi:protocatechuate 3,4-dioxygenase, alpha subunit
MTLRRTPSQTVGPFYTIGLCRGSDSDLEPDGVELSGRLIDGRGEPVADGMIEVLEAETKRWGRSPTDGDGRFAFRVAAGARRLEVWVFARGLLRHELTRIYLDGGADAEDETLIAVRDGDGFRFDIRLQGEKPTLFFEH